jgi:hypothetical protein
MRHLKRFESERGLLIVSTRPESDETRVQLGACDERSIPGAIRRYGRSRSPAGIFIIAPRNRFLSHRLENNDRTSWWTKKSLVQWPQEVLFTCSMGSLEGQVLFKAAGGVQNLCECDKIIQSTTAERKNRVRTASVAIVVFATTPRPPALTCQTRVSRSAQTKTRMLSVA